MNINRITMKKYGMLAVPVASLVFIIMAACSVSAQQSSAPDELLWDMNKLRETPAFSWLKQDSVVVSLTYKSIDYDGKPTTVFAYYSNPDIIAGKPVSGKKFPGVVLIHGGGGRAFPQWVAKWARLGYAAIAMDLAGKDGYGNLLPGGGPDQSNENKIMNFSKDNVKKAWPYHAIGSVIVAHSLLLSFPEVDQQRTAVTGISWGGYLTCVTAGLDNRFKAAVPVYGCAYLVQSDIFKKQLGKLDEATQKIWLEYYDPQVYLRNAKMPVMFINGNKDKHYNVVPFHQTYNLVPAANRFLCIKPDMKHNHPAGWENVEIAMFFDQVWTGQTQLPQVKKTTVNASTITVNYQSVSPLKEAALYYSNDDTSLNEERKWDFVKATVDPLKKEVLVAVPVVGYKYAFIQLVAENSATASTEYFIKPR